MQNYENNTYMEQKRAYNADYNLDRELISREILLALQKNNSQNDEIIRLLRKIKNIQKAMFETENFFKKIETHLENVDYFWDYKGFDVYKRKNIKKHKKNRLERY